MPSRSRNKRPSITEDEAVDRLDDFFPCKRCTHRDKPVDCETAREDNDYQWYVPYFGCAKGEH